MAVSSVCPRLVFSHCVNCVLYKNYPAARSCEQQTNNGPPAWRVANTPYHKNIKVYEMERTDRDLDRLNGYSKTMMIQE